MAQGMTSEIADWRQAAAARGLVVTDLAERVATSIEWRETGADIRFTTGGGAVCTADLAAHTHEFAMPAQLQGRRLELELSYDDWDGVDRLVVE